MFVRWSCGCKGLILDGHCWVIKACDGTDSCLGLYERDMTDRKATIVPVAEYEAMSDEEKWQRVPKPCLELDYDEVVTLLTEMGRLIGDGYRFRDLQHLLGHTWPSHSGAEPSAR